MDYEYIENLVSASKSGSTKAKEALALEFTPLINSICRRTFIYGYESSDIRNECLLLSFTALINIGQKLIALLLMLQMP